MKTKKKLISRVAPLLLGICISGCTSKAEFLPPTEDAAEIFDQATDMNIEADISEDIQLDVDTNPPTVTRTSPEDVATLVAKDATITATFSENMLGESVTTSSFTLSEANGDVAGSVSFDSSTNTATFKPENPLEKITRYTATLSSSITDLNGNALVEVSWSFTSADGGWGIPEPIETANVGNARSPEIAIGADGSIVAVWTNNDRVWTNRFENGKWGSSTSINTFNSRTVSKPKIAVDRDGKVIAIWAQFDGSVYNTWANYFDGNDWGTQSQIANDAGGPSDYSAIAFIDPDNAFVILEDNSTPSDVWTIRYSGNWSPAKRLESDNAGIAWSPHIAADGMGGAMSVWAQNDGTRTNIWASRFDGFWNAPTLIESDNAGSASNPKVAFDREGNAISVWSQDDGSVRNIWANRFDGTSWSTPTPIETQNEGSAFSPEIAFDNEGNAIAVWTQDDGSVHNIWTNRFDGTSWGAAERLETNLKNSGVPQIGFDHRGKAIAVWTQSDQIWANRFDGTTWGSAERIETNPEDAGQPSLVVDNEGNFVVVWKQDDKVWANYFK